MWELLAGNCTAGSTTTCAGKVDHKLPVNQSKGHTYTCVSDPGNLRTKTLYCRGKSFKCQFHTTHVGAVGWEPHSSSTMTSAGKADHGFGVCVPLALINILSFENSDLNCSTT